MDGTKIESSKERHRQWFRQKERDNDGEKDLMGH